jgi:hypothetical protein
MSFRIWTLASGSGDWNNTANWSGGAVPVTGDDVLLFSGNANIDTNLNQSAVTLASLTIGMGFTGTIGTTSADLQISATKWTIGTPASGSSSAASGSGRIRINFGTNAFDGTMLDSASIGLDAGLDPVRIKGTHASNKLNLVKGRLGIAMTQPGVETSQVPTINVSGGNLSWEQGMTAPTTVINNGGTIYAYVAPATLTNSSGIVYVFGTTAITNLVTGGTTYLNNRPAGAAITTTCKILSDGVLDTRGNPASLTITPKIEMYEQSALYAFSPQQITASGGYQAMECGLGDIVVQVGDNPNFTLT